MEFRVHPWVTIAEMSHTHTLPMYEVCQKRNRTVCCLIFEWDINLKCFAKIISEYTVNPHLPHSTCLTHPTLSSVHVEGLPFLGSSSTYSRPSLNSKPREGDLVLSPHTCSRRLSASGRVFPSLSKHFRLRPLICVHRLIA